MVRCGGKSVETDLSGAVGDRHGSGHPGSMAESRSSLARSTALSPQENLTGGLEDKTAVTS